MNSIVITASIKGNTIKFYSLHVYGMSVTSPDMKGSDYEPVFISRTPTGMPITVWPQEVIASKIGKETSFTINTEYLSADGMGGKDRKLRIIKKLRRYTIDNHNSFSWASEADKKCGLSIAEINAL